MNNPDLASPLSKTGTNGQHVLLIHSFTGTPAQVRPLADELSAAGYGVTVPLLSGHGTKLEDMGEYGWKDWANDVRLAAKSITEAPLHVVGVSMGGLLAIALSSELDAGTFTLINTPVRFRKAKTYLAPVVRFVKPIHRWPEEATVDRPPNAEYRVQYDGYAMGALASFVVLSMVARTKASRVQAPTLIVQTRNDPDTHPTSATYLGRKIPAADRSILWLDGDDHEALLSEGAQLVSARILEHLDRYSA